MSPRQMQLGIVAPVLGDMARILNMPVLASVPAMVVMLAIAGQESNWTERRQGGRGPARGFWQFEVGGVHDVLDNLRAASHLRVYAHSIGMRPLPSWLTEKNRLADSDALACAFARLLLWISPAHLTLDRDAMWDLYLAQWRPGKPHPAVWPVVWRQAVAAVGVS